METSQAAVATAESGRASCESVAPADSSMATVTGDADHVDSVHDHSTNSNVGDDSDDEDVIRSREK